MREGMEGEAGREEREGGGRRRKGLGAHQGYQG